VNNRGKYTIIGLIMGSMVYSIYLELTGKCYLLKISARIHDEATMKSGSSGFFQYELCVMAKFFNCGFITLESLHINKFIHKS